MRIAEYKKTDTKIITEEIIVDDYNEEGEVIGQHTETTTKEIAVMSMVYRDMTEEEVAEYEKSIAEMPKPPYAETVERLIRERYTISDELAILRQRDSKPYEFAEYNDYAEECKARAKEI